MSVRDRMVNGKAVYRSGDIDERAPANRPQPAKREPKAPAPPAEIRDPCRFLGDAKMNVKVACGQPLEACHECLHPERPATERKGVTLPPMALPAATCRQMDGRRWQPCAMCPLHESASQNVES
jgi:hypothetical protein